MTDLTPGPEMDRAVAEAVGFAGEIRNNLMELGRTAFYREGAAPMRSWYPWHPSRDLVDVVEALEATGLPWGMNKRLGNRGYWVSIGTIFDGYPMGEADTIPEAACRAILAWAEAKDRGGE